MKELGFKVTITTKNNIGDISKDLFVLKRINMGNERDIKEVFEDIEKMMKE